MTINTDKDGYPHTINLLRIFTKCDFVDPKKIFNECMDFFNTIVQEVYGMDYSYGVPIASDDEILISNKYRIFLEVSGDYKLVNKIEKVLKLKLEKSGIDIIHIITSVKHPMRDVKEQHVEEFEMIYKRNEKYVKFEEGEDK